MEQYKEKQEKDVHSEQLDFSPSTGSLNIKQDVADIQGIIGRENINKVTKISLSGSLRNLHDIHFDEFQNLASIEARYGIGDNLPLGLNFDCQLLSGCKNLKYVLISDNYLENVESLPLIGGKGWQIQRQFIIDRFKTRSEGRKERDTIITGPVRQVPKKEDPVEKTSPEIPQETISLSKDSSIEIVPITEQEQAVIRSSNYRDIAELMSKKRSGGLNKMTDSPYTLKLSAVDTLTSLTGSYHIAFNPYMVSIIPLANGYKKPLGIKLTGTAVQNGEKIEVKRGERGILNIYVGTEMLSVGDIIQYANNSVNPQSLAQNGEKFEEVYSDMGSGKIYTYYKSIRNEAGQSSQQLRGCDESGKTLFFLQIKGTVGVSGIKNISAQSNGDIDIYYRSSNDVGIKILRDVQTGELRTFQLLQKGLIDEDILDILDQNGKKIPCANGKK